MSPGIINTLNQFIKYYNPNFILLIKQKLNNRDPDSC